MVYLVLKHRGAIVVYLIDVYTCRKFSVVTIPLTSIHVVVTCGLFTQEQGGAATLAVR